MVVKFSTNKSVESNWFSAKVSEHFWFLCFPEKQKLYEFCSENWFRNENILLIWETPVFRALKHPKIDSKVFLLDHWVCYSHKKRLTKSNGVDICDLFFFASTKSSILWTEIPISRLLHVEKFTVKNLVFLFLLKSWNARNALNLDKSRDSNSSLLSIACSILTSKLQGHVNWKLTDSVLCVKKLFCLKRKILMFLLLTSTPTQVSQKEHEHFFPSRSQIAVLCPSIFELHFSELKPIPLFPALKF